MGYYPVGQQNRTICLDDLITSTWDNVSNLAVKVQLQFSGEFDFYSGDYNQLELHYQTSGF